MTKARRDSQQAIDFALHRQTGHGDAEILRAMKSGDRVGIAGENCRVGLGAPQCCCGGGKKHYFPRAHTPSFLLDVWRALQRLVVLMRCAAVFSDSSACTALTAL